MVSKTSVQAGLSDIPLKQLWAFESVFRNGSIAAASMELSLTPSAVSHRIAKLEDALGFRLFARSRGGVSPSTQGMEFAQLLGPALTALATAGQEVTAAEAAKLDVHVAPGYPSAAVLESLPEFLASISGPIQVSWTLLRQQKHARRVDADVLLYVSGSSLGATRLQETLLLLRAPDYAVRPPDFTLLQEPEHWAESWTRSTGVDLGTCPRLSFGDPLAMVDACVLGLGVCAAPARLVVGHIRAGSLVRAHPSAVPWEAPEVVLTARGKRKVVARQFAAWASGILSSSRVDEEASGA
jgi:DNA-binding transcriptional LysR family regulator